MGAAHNVSMSIPTLDAPTRSTFVNRDPDGRWGKGPGNDYSGEALSNVEAVEDLSLHSDFIDESPVNQEAAALFATRFPNHNATDFDDAVLDTWPSMAEFRRDLRESESPNSLSPLAMFRDQLEAPDELPYTGGVVVFYS